MSTEADRWAVVRFDFAAFCDAKTEWSRETFGPGDRYAGVVAHLRKELLEIEAEPSDLEEWVDVILLALDGAWRSAGACGADVVAALIAKDAKNRARSWPDWRTLAPDQVSEHLPDLRDGGCLAMDTGVRCGRPTPKARFFCDACNAGVRGVGYAPFF